MANTETKRTFARAEFPNTACNAPTLRAEIVAAALASATIDSVAEVAGTVEVRFSGLLSSTDQTTLDTIIATHQGEAFGPTPVDEIVNPEMSDDSGNEVLRAQLEAGPVPEATYLLGWALQVATTTPGAGDGARARITAQINGGAEIEVDVGTERAGDWSTVSGSHPVRAVAGNRYTLRAYFQRIGNAGNPAKVRCVRLFLAALE